jgi:hypothetical protein
MTRRLCHICKNLEATKPCCFCPTPITHCEGNNAAPVKKRGDCCGYCNIEVVFRERAGISYIGEPSRKPQAAVNAIGSACRPAHQRLSAATIPARDAPAGGPPVLVSRRGYTDG